MGDIDGGREAGDTSLGRDDEVTRTSESERSEETTESGGGTHGGVESESELHDGIPGTGREDAVADEEEPEAPISLWKNSGHWMTFLIGVVLFYFICRILLWIYTSSVAVGGNQTGIGLLGG